MSRVTGVVQAVSEKSGGSGKKKWINRAFCIDDVWYGGFVERDEGPTRELQLSIQPGDTIDFAAEKNGQYTNWTDLKRTGEAAVVSTPAGGTVNLLEYKKTLGGTLKVAAEIGNVLVTQGFVKLDGDPEAVKLQYIELVYGIAKDLADRAVAEVPGE